MRLRGLLYEFGEVLPAGIGLAKALPPALAGLDERLPAMLVDSLREQWARVRAIGPGNCCHRTPSGSALRDTPSCQAVADIPGVGLLTATAAVATIGEANTFKSGREFAAWLGLVPRQTGTGGRVRQLGSEQTRATPICARC